MLLPYQFGCAHVAISITIPIPKPISNHIPISHMPIAFPIFFFAQKEIFHASIGGKGNATLTKLN